MQFCFQKHRSDTWDFIVLLSAPSGSSENVNYLEKFSLGFNILFSVFTRRYQNHRGVCWSATWALQRTKTTPSTICLPDLAWCKELFYVSTISSQHNGNLDLDIVVESQQLMRPEFWSHFWRKVWWHHAAPSTMQQFEQNS